MPLALEDLRALQAYVDGFPGCPVFVKTEDMSDGATECKYTILAGKVSWAGLIKEGIQMDRLDNWLTEKEAKVVNGWKELQELFA